jgi:hypothetical protein
MKQRYPTVVTFSEITGTASDGEVIARSQAEPELFALLFRRYACPRPSATGRVWPGYSHQEGPGGRRFAVLEFGVVPRAGQVP